MIACVRSRARVGLVVLIAVPALVAFIHCSFSPYPPPGVDGGPPEREGEYGGTSAVTGPCHGAGYSTESTAECCSGQIQDSETYGYYQCACGDPGTRCSAASDCCHGTCSDGACACFASGAACETTSECCSGSCIDGKCGCAATGTPCGELSGQGDCCTLHCSAGVPDEFHSSACVDPGGGECSAASDCAPYEQCGGARCCLGLGATPGTGSYASCCPGLLDRYTEQATSDGGVCCSPGGAACAGAGDCCSGDCSKGACACAAAGALCEGDGLCCSGTCDNGACACLGVSAACADDRACCSGSCASGECACSATGAACTQATDCCFGVCQGGTCACAAKGALCSADSLCCSEACVDGACG